MPITSKLKPPDKSRSTNRLAELSGSAENFKLESQQSDMDEYFVLTIDGRRFILDADLDDVHLYEVTPSKPQPPEQK
jgi:hypothetical protein